MIYNFNMSILKIYTDGACSGNQNKTNIGGWGAILEFDESKKELCGGEINTSNSKMELTAVIEAFKALKREDLRIQVFTDSAYVANCFREGWYETWRRNGWRNAKKEPVEHRELWEDLIEMVEKNRVIFYRVKGHVNVNSRNVNLDAHYEKFVEMNGKAFSFSDFLYITEMNNRADALANHGMDEIRQNKEL